MLSATDGEVNGRPRATSRRQAGSVTSSYVGGEVQQQEEHAAHDELRGRSSRVNNIQSEIFNSTEASVRESDLRMRAENQLISRFTIAIENMLQTVRGNFSR